MAEAIKGAFNSKAAAVAVAAAGIGLATGLILSRCCGGRCGSKGGGRGGEVESADVAHPNPHCPDGRSMHVQTSLGDTANRIVSVGDHGRARRFAALLDEGSVSMYPSSRGFRSYTGTFRGVAVTVVATGMGIPMADFLVRELRSTTQGPMAFVRVGTCGGLHDTVPGCVVVATEGAALLREDTDLMRAPVPAGDHGPARLATPRLPYVISRPVPSDPALSAALEAALRRELPAAGLQDTTKTGMAVTADYFYSSQGHHETDFTDRNGGVQAAVEAEYAAARSFEMETFHILDLADRSKAEGRGRVRASGCAICIDAGELLLDEALRPRIEMAAGRAALEAITAVEL